ncbi:hypothetical protein H4S14_003756 [Agrobacterium vitis]|nr:hypothetical protein [Agrobacterium vitis]MBE1439987.1 hypothetical protein [Agrobacterium vitis]
MATSSRTVKRRKRSIVFPVAIALVVIAALYSAGWFAAANYATSKLERAFDGDSPLASALDCANMRVGGFPLRISLKCSKITVNDSHNGITGSIGAFRSAAKIFKPGTIHWDLNGPAIFQTSTGLATSVQWDRFESAMAVGIAGLENETTTVKTLRTNITQAVSGATLTISASEARLEIQRSSDDLLTTSRFTDVVFQQNDGNSKLPPMIADLDLKLIGQANAFNIDNPQPILLRGLNGELRGLQVDIGEGRTITASGPLSIDQEGYLSGTLKLEIGKVEGWRDMVIAAYPETTEIAKMAAKGLKMAFFGQNHGQVTLQITHGTVVLGFIPLGNIPPI